MSIFSELATWVGSIVTCSTRFVAESVSGCWYIAHPYGPYTYLLRDTAEAIAATVAGMAAFIAIVRITTITTRAQNRNNANEQEGKAN